MAPRANWKGYLRLSLVSCPIALYPASSLSEQPYFEDIPELKLPKDMLDLASHIVSNQVWPLRSGPFRGSLRERPR